AALIRNKLTEFPDIDYDLREMRDRQRFRLGAFDIDPLAVTHSIPHAVALAMRTPVGVVVHTGDFKIDPDPLDGRLTDIPGLRAYGEEGVAVLLSDSTNSEKSGHTWSERDVEGTLREIIERAPYRVFLTTFASHIDRIQAVLDGAMHAGRRVIPLGRSMQANIGMALEMGLLRASPSILAEASEFPSLPRNKVVVLAAGSQGEPMSSMTRLAEARLTPVAVEPGDQVIFSSRRIPGNERAIGQMMNNLVRLGAEVITDHAARVHSSGHGFNEEQLQMLSLCRPRAFVPLHGEYRHMVRHAALAAEAGVHPDRIFVTEDGFPLEVTRIDGDLMVERLPKVQAGLVFVDGKGIGDVGEVVLRDRRILSESGIIVCVVIMSSDGRVVAGPELATRGVVYVDESLELLHRAAESVREALDNAAHAIELETYMEEVRLALRRFFRRELDRKPLIVPMVIKLPGG
ncbi:MAG TPA: ribonuclease J, partial [Myxococcota bacterium]|nr:ribonuclease J [Myxococcota bacterium]